MVHLLPWNFAVSDMIQHSGMSAAFRIFPAWRQAISEHAFAVRRCGFTDMGCSDIVQKNWAQACDGISPAYPRLP